MTKDLPAAPLPDDIIDRIAKEVAAQVRAHIEYAYPAAAAAVAWFSAAFGNINGLIAPIGYAKVETAMRP